MKLHLTVETHKDKAGNWVAQVMLGGYVLHEQTGPVSQTQAVDNAVSSFAIGLRDLLDEQEERASLEFEEAEPGET